MDSFSEIERLGLLVIGFFFFPRSRLSFLFLLALSESLVFGLFIQLVSFTSGVEGVVDVSDFLNVDRLPCKFNLEVD